MAYKDLHKSPFDDSTIAKLNIFQQYAEAWIPTFVMQNRISEIHIFDFFAGPGYDKNGIPGSPIRILTEIQRHKKRILQKEVDIFVHLNEFEANKIQQRKFEQLQQSCSTFIEENESLPKSVKLKYHNKAFESLFPDLLPIIKLFPSLVYLDQNGIKFLSEKYLLKLEKTKQTDFIYFAASSYLGRFRDQDEFRNHVNIDITKAKEKGYNQIHNIITQELRKKLPVGTKLKLYPFSIKKGSNIYGIIFGASHPRAVDKFLSIAWQQNKENGTANFDIDNDATKGQGNLFKERELTKVESFKQQLRDKVLNGQITNNSEALDYTYEQGHIGTHASDCLKALKHKGKINFEERSPYVTYDSVYKKKNRVDYKIIGVEENQD